MRLPPAIGRVYDEHAQALFGYLLSFTRDETDTKDVLQELFLRLTRDPVGLEKVENERAYLMRLAHNLAVDCMRRNSSRRKAGEALQNEPAEIFMPTAEPDRRLFQSALDAALAMLPPEQRAVVYLKLWEQNTFQEISELLGIGLNTAASRYRYGIDKLREHLRPLYEEVTING